MKVSIFLNQFRSSGKLLESLYDLGRFCENGMPGETGPAAVNISLTTFPNVSGYTFKKQDRSLNFDIMCCHSLAAAANLKHVDHEIERLKKQLEADRFIFSSQVKRVNILNIDDDTDDCELLKLAFMPFPKIEYVAIHHPAHAIDCLMQGMMRPDLIILDLNMPVMNGIEVLTRLKEDNFLHNIPVVIFTTNCTPGLKEAAARLGAIECITKPSNFSKIDTVVKKFLSFI